MAKKITGGGGRINLPKDDQIVLVAALHVALRSGLVGPFGAPVLRRIARELDDGTLRLVRTK